MLFIVTVIFRIVAKTLKWIDFEIRLFVSKSDEYVVMES